MNSPVMTHSRRATCLPAVESASAMEDRCLPGNCGV